MNSINPKNAFEKLLISLRKYKLLRPFVDLFFKYKEIVMYLIFGVLTTLVDFAVYFPLANILNVHYLLSNLFAWIAAVIFAFVTNKLWVFESNARTLPEILREFTSFVLSRLFSGAVETALLWLLVDVLILSENIAKIPVAVLTVGFTVVSVVFQISSLVGSTVGFGVLSMFLLVQPQPVSMKW